MQSYFLRTGAMVLSCSLSLAFGQQTGSQGATPPPSSSPIYRVTVVERTVKAINYQYRAEPTLIDFRGTVLMPKAHGVALVESKQGRTQVDVKFENVTAPSQYGPEYLTYVLWALTPDGRPHNLAEVIPNTGDKTHLHVTTDLQAFALIVTAEPYSAVRQPSDVVVLENEIRKDTIGKIEQVDAKYELLPRGQYAWRLSDNATGAGNNGPKVSMRQYEALSELYQAQSAIAAARQAHADLYAAPTLQRAQTLLDEAQQLQSRKAEPNRVVQDAREAAQTAEDARVIAEQHRQQDGLAQARAETATARKAQIQAEADLRQAQERAQVAQAQADAERVARERAEAEAANARQRAVESQPAPQYRTAPPSAAIDPRSVPSPTDSRKSQMRRELLVQLGGLMETRDTPRGLVVTVADADFDGGELRAASMQRLARMSSVIASSRDLRIEVEGHSDSEATSSIAAKRAAEVRSTLAVSGIAPSRITARSLGDSRPLVSNSSPSGRQQNRRVEVVISGDAIGTVPVWDRTYSLTER